MKIPAAPEDTEVRAAERTVRLFSQGRFRHGTRFLRWRPDKAPRQCTLARVKQESGVAPVKLD